MDYELRRLTQNDLAAMRRLNRLFGEVFDDPASYHDKLPADAYLVNFLMDKRNIVLIAKSDNQVIGGLVAYHLQKFESQRSEVFLYDLAVSSDHQRQGIGTSLMHEIQKVAGDLGAYVAFLQADVGDEAVEFYRSLTPSEDLATINFDFPATSDSTSRHG